VYKAHLRTYAVENLREIIGTGGPALEGLLKQIEFIRLYQSNEGLTLIDTKDEFNTHQYNFGGLDNVLLQFGQQLSGALGIPLVRLFGQSPSGMNATGESDLKIYYDNIKQQQERRLSTPLTKLLTVLFPSVLGKAIPEDYNFQFRHLLQLSEAERADVAQKTTATVLEAYDMGLISQQVALKELRQSSKVTGQWSNITDALIAAAEEELPDASLETELPQAAHEGPSQAPSVGTASEAD
jgi:phage-related protein (TIGR01555 family)